VRRKVSKVFEKGREAKRSMGQEALATRRTLQGPVEEEGEEEGEGEEEEEAEDVAVYSSRMFLPPSS